MKTNKLSVKEWMIVLSFLGAVCVGASYTASGVTSEYYAGSCYLTTVDHKLEALRVVESSTDQCTVQWLSDSSYMKTYSCAKASVKWTKIKCPNQ